MKIIGKALCDQVYPDRKISLLGVVQNFFIDKGSDVLTLPGFLFVSLRFEESDRGKNTAIKIYCENSKKEQIVFFNQKTNVDDNFKDESTGINIVVDLSSKITPHLLRFGEQYNFWLEFDEESSGREFLTDIVLLKRK